MRFIRKHAVFLVILLVMLIYRLVIWRHTQVYLYGDMYRYDAMARHLLLNGYMGIGSQPDAYYTPGYSLFLAAVYKISMWTHGGHLLPIIRVAHEVYFVQQLLSLVNLVLVYILGSLFFNRWTGNAAALIAALYLPNSFVGELLLSENLFIPFLLLSLWTAYLALRHRRYSLYVLAGIVLGLATLVRPFILPIVVLYLVGIWWQARTGRIQGDRPYRQGLYFAFALVIGLVVALLPWWIRNYIDFHHFVPLSTEAGNPLLAGASPYFQTPFSQLAAGAIAHHETQEKYAIHLILDGLTHHFFLYMGWFLFGKLYYLFWSPWLYNYIGWFVVYHRILTILGSISVIAGLFIRRTRLFAVSIVFLLAMQLVFLPLFRYGYPLVVMMGALLPAVVAYLLKMRRRGTPFVEK